LLDLHSEVYREQAEKHGADGQGGVAAVIAQFSQQWQAKYSVELLLFGSLDAGLPLSGDKALFEHFRVSRSEFVPSLPNPMMHRPGYKAWWQHQLTTVP
jgi:hypothetical protein